MDSIINDFVAGSLEYITYKAWQEKTRLEKKYNIPVFDPLQEFENITGVITDL